MTRAEQVQQARELTILGVDAGITTGLAIIRLQGGEWSLLSRADYRSSAELRGDQLLGLDGWLAMASFDVVAMEEMLAFGKNSADEKIEAQAVVKLHCARHKIPLATYAPVTIRSRVMGHGQATERDIKATLRYLLSMGKTSRKGEAFTSHQQDAIAVALCHAIKQHGLVLDRAVELRGGSK